MADMVTLSCPSCGARLEVTADADRFACAYCGKEHLVRRAAGTALVKPVTEAMGRVQAGVDRAASELAIRRLRAEMAELASQKSQIDAARGPTSPSGCLLWTAMAALVVVCFVFAVPGLAVVLRQQDGPTLASAIAAALLSIAAGVAGGLWLQRRNLRNRQRAASQREGVERLLSEKTAELERHQRRVANSV
jgi:predicted RNA-binding Zn-ribbon protein involved in translation (DUF1610 family)